MRTCAISVRPRIHQPNSVTVTSELSGFVQKSFFLEILSCLEEIARPAQIAPIIIIGSKSEDFFPAGGKTQIGSDDGKHTFFNHHGKKARRNDVDAGKR